MSEASTLLASVEPEWPDTESVDGERSDVSSRVARTDYGTAPNRILVLGDADTTFDAVFGELANHGVDAVRAHEISACAASLHANKATGVVLTIDAASLAERSARKELARSLTGTLHKLLPLLAQPAQVLVLARGTDETQKSRMDKEIQSVIGKISRQATNEYGVNLTITAVDITGNVDTTVIARRAVELFDAREEVTTGELLDYTEIENQSIGCALALRFVY
ncbi:hypothetical protein D9V29_09140 [Mycetocola manganoxydans]|uniref:Uncharacterized protein n=1 Tax=Mycetocola manganoxydans TaxID=699879 RepID=A0A3L6ZUB5_9MICO|nr:hypothetical protein [Mycetocola manganoxydans]RLP71484.1 hypothetical protein D9V29_09140 [Mycetocola manganoxydans]GHD46786.1 hypothetical protein GCM10008097_17160 [Mycetocola manganoxydans]